MISWFLFDLGNTVIKLAYERVLANICRTATVGRNELVEILEMPGSYRDLERGALTFAEFHDFLRDRAGYRGSVQDLVAVWTDFFDGLMPGIEELLDRVRQKYRIAFVSNSNEVHATVIPRLFPTAFRDDDRLILSHRLKAAKPDPDFFRRALELLGSRPQNVVFIDDLIDNVLAARSVGIKAFQFADTSSLTRELEAEGLL